jgi:hypothetical protein
VDLVFDVTRFAAEIAPQKIRAFAVVPALVTPLLGGHSRSTSPQIEFGTINWDQERRKLRRVIRYIYFAMTSGCRASPPGRRCYRIPLEYALSALPGSSMRDFMSQHRRKPSRRMENPTSFRGHTRDSLQLRAN